MTPQEFEAHLAEHGVCQIDGPARAYFEILMPGNARGEPYHQVWRYIYTSIKVFADHEAELWEKLWAFLHPEILRIEEAGSVLIFWRARPEVEPVPADSEWRPRGALRLYCRLVVPGIDFEPLIETKTDRSIFL